MLHSFSRIAVDDAIYSHISNVLIKGLFKLNDSDYCSMANSIVLAIFRVCFSTIFFCRMVTFAFLTDVHETCPADARNCKKAKWWNCEVQSSWSPWASAWRAVDWGKSSFDSTCNSRTWITSARLAESCFSAWQLEQYFSCYSIEVNRVAFFSSYWYKYSSRDYGDLKLVFY